ncbi:MAG: uroporphyrinogen decarboxylase family protein [Deltaproteobacteria bacterium]|nr:uroporphyrinogen decarboxylase family protein [Deltaproteobacteria bacterium]
MDQPQKPRQETMTSGERMHSILMRQRPDRVPFMPFIFGYCAKNVGYPIRAVYDDAEKSFWAQMLTAEMFGYDGGALYGYASYGGWEFGGDIKMPESQWEQAPIVTRFPALTPEEVEALEVPEVENAGCYPIHIEFAKIQQQFGMPIMVFVPLPFNAAGNICEVETLCRWMIKKPDTAHMLLRKTTDFANKVTDYFVDNFPNYPMMPFTGTASSANQIISPKQFKEYVLPYDKDVHQHIIDRGIKNIFCHICGEQNLNLPYWAEIEYGDPGILSFGHEVDLTKAVEIFGDKHAIAGNVEPRVIQEGTWQEVYDLCKEAIFKAKDAPSGYLLMAGCEVPVQAPGYNLFAMKKAIMDYGFYD